MLDDLLAPNYFDHTVQQGLELYKQSLAIMYKGFPDFCGTIEDIIAEGDKVCVLFTATATHTGEWNFFGVPLAPTGKKITGMGVNIYRIVDGKVVEGWTDYNFQPDQLDLLMKLGVIEYTEKGKQLFPEEDEQSRLGRIKELTNLALVK